VKKETTRHRPGGGGTKPSIEQESKAKYILQKPWDNPKLGHKDSESERGGEYRKRFGGFRSNFNTPQKRIIFTETHGGQT